MLKYRIRPIPTGNLHGIQRERETFPSFIIRFFFTFTNPRKKWVWQRDSDNHIVTFTNYDSAERYIYDEIESYSKLNSNHSEMLA